MYKANFLTETQPGVFERKVKIKGVNVQYPTDESNIERVTNILKNDLAHYRNMLPIIEREMPYLIGRYVTVCAIGGGNPKFEAMILRAKNIGVADMNAGIYIKTDPLFRELYDAADTNIYYCEQVLKPPMNGLGECTTFVHFLEHMNNFKQVKDWINAQDNDIVIYMPCIEAANDENWFHYISEHNVFFTVDAICEVGKDAGYKCKSLRYSDDMLIWMYK